ncbi:hypothetical protein [Kitasatospora sp. NPDC002040]|uniref:hypothetical protein n=1 Tax=Kitasatospora sp. NPDC002040 TaxID=3154661 RepID=UPI003321446B
MHPATGPLADAIRRFPLVPRARALSLAERVQRLTDLARQADEQNSPRDASAVHNLAALLATDTGQPEDAQQLCRNHADLYLAAQPLNSTLANLALEPLVNLASLKIRYDDGDTAFELLNLLADSVTTRTDTVLDGHLVVLAGLTATDLDHREVCERTENIRLYDGPVPWSGPGRWLDAHAHLRRGDGIARRIYGGRQVAVIATATSGNTASALDLLTRTPHERPWEHAVGAALTVLCLLAAGRPAADAGEAMLERFEHTDRAQDPLTDTASAWPSPTWLPPPVTTISPSGQRASPPGAPRRTRTPTPPARSCATRWSSRA